MKTKRIAIRIDEKTYKDIIKIKDHLEHYSLSQTVRTLINSGITTHSNIYNKNKKRWIDVIGGKMYE